MDDGWKIGKVFQFSKHKEKTKSAQKYKDTVAEVSDNSIGVLCSWYISTKESPSQFQLNQRETAFSYFPLSSYLRTLQEGELEITDISVSSDTPSSILSKTTNSKLCQAKAFIIDDKTKVFIETEFKANRVQS